MKNGLLTVLIFLFMLPALTPWLPHGVLHALHEYKAIHNEESHSHGHAGHDHEAVSIQAAHHPIHFDVVTYFNDYLRVDLRSAEQVILKAPVSGTYDLDYPLAVVINPMPRYALASVQSQKPPDTQRYEPDKTPLYLATQRLRI